MTEPTITQEDEAKAREFHCATDNGMSEHVLLSGGRDYPGCGVCAALASFRAAARAEGEVRGLDRATETIRKMPHGYTSEARDFRLHALEKLDALRALAAEEGGEG